MSANLGIWDRRLKNVSDAETSHKYFLKLDYCPYDYNLIELNIVDVNGNTVSAPHVLSIDLHSGMFIRYCSVNSDIGLDLDSAGRIEEGVSR